MKFCERLSLILSQKKISENLSASEVARRMGVERQIISDWKNGRSKPGIEIIPELAAALGVDVSELLGETPARIGLDVSDWGSIPILGKIPAGKPLEAIQDDNPETIAVPPQLAKPGYFALRVQGDSMTPKIVSGDIVVIGPCPECRDRLIVACVVNDDIEATIKRFRIISGVPHLVPDNPDYEPIRLTADVRILGCAVGVYRKL